MATDLDAERREVDHRVRRVRQLVDQVAAVSASSTFHIQAAVFGDWLLALDQHTFHAYLHEDGQVHAFVQGFYRKAYFAVHTQADALEGHELPPHDSDRPFLEVPTAEAARLVEFRAVSSVGGEQT